MIFSKVKFSLWVVASLFHISVKTRRDNYIKSLYFADGSKISDPVQLKEEHGANFQEIFDTKSVLRRGISPEIINLGLSLVKETYVLYLGSIKHWVLMVILSSLLLKKLLNITDPDIFEAMRSSFFPLCKGKLGYVYAAAEH